MIAILLPTRQGQVWLPAMLDSVHRQSLADWMLLARDDRSSDKTQRVLTIAAERDRRIRPLRDWEPTQGRAENLGILLEQALASPASHFVLAEQEDVWLADRLERQATAMRELETVHGADTPLLVCSDASVTDADLRMMHPSLNGYLAGVREAQPSLRTLLAGGFTARGTLFGNRALLELAAPLPGTIRTADEWFAVCAAAAGHVRFLAQPTVKCRLHARNIRARLGSRLRAIRWWQGQRAISTLGYQAQALADRLQERGVNAVDGERGSERNGPAQVREFAKLFAVDCSRLRRAWRVARLGVSRPGVLNRFATPLSAMLCRSSGWTPTTPVTVSEASAAVASPPANRPALRRAA